MRLGASFLASLLLGGGAAAGLLAGLRGSPAVRSAWAAAFAPALAALAASIGLCLPTMLGFGRAGGLAPVVAGLALAVAAFAIGRSTSAATKPAPAIERMPTALRVALLALAVAGGLAALRLTLASGHGGWDAHAWWNHMARVLVRAEDPAAGLVNTNYPLLVPSWVATLWTAAGSESPRAPQLVTLAWTGGAGLVLFAALARQGAADRGLAAAALLLTAPPVIYQTSTQYADLAVGYLLLGAAALLAHSLRERASTGERVLAGVCLGLLPWTKNEGALWAAGALAAFVVVRAGSRHPAPAEEPSIPRALGPVALGALPPLLLLAAYKALWASEWGSQSILQMLDAESPDRLLAAGRWRLPLRALAGELTPSTSLRGWGLATALAVALVAWRARRRPWPGAERFLALLLAGFTTALVLIYVLTPQPQEWHISSSFGRLFVQGFPTALLLAFAPPAGEAGGGAR